MSTKPNLKPTLQALLDRDRRGLGDHPTPETLVAYHAGAIPAAEQEALRNHLTLCHDCADLLLDLVSFAEFTPPEQTPALADVEVESAWQKFQPRLVAVEEAEPKVETERMPGVAQIAERRREEDQGSAYAVVNWRQKTQVAYAIAATLLIGAIGLSLWGVSLKRQVVKDTEPQGNIAFVDARSEKDRTRSGEEVASAPGQKRFVLLLAPDLEDPKEDADYAVDIFRSGASGPRITSVDGLKRMKDGSFTVELSGKLIPPGVYRVEFYGVNGAHREPLDTLSFTIAAP